MHVLLVFNVPKVMRNKQLFNLFSLYGNIERILLSRSQGMAVITFENEKDQLVALHYLDRQTLYDSTLRLMPVKYPFILLQKCPLLPLLNLLEFLYLDSLSKEVFHDGPLYFRSNVLLYFQNLKKLTASNAIIYLLKSRLKPNQVVDFGSFLKPLFDFLFGFDEFFASLQNHANRQQFQRLRAEPLTIEFLSRARAESSSVAESFETFAVKRLPFEVDIVNYRNNQKKNKDGSKSKKINRPNRILYIFNLSASLSLDSLKDLFEGFEKVHKYFYLNESKNSALFYFGDTQAACHILCAFKNMKFIEK